MEMDRCLKEHEKRISTMTSLSDCDPIKVLTELKCRLQNMNALGSHPKTKVIVKRSVEAVDVLLSKVDRAYENLEFDTHLINQIIVYHFLQGKNRCGSNCTFEAI